MSPLSNKQRGESFEHFVAQWTPQICNLLGFAERSIVAVHHRIRFRGSVQLRHEIDLAVETVDGWILIECKDHQRLTRPPLLDSYFSVVDIARAHPDQQVVGVIVSALPLADGPRSLVERGHEVFHHPVNSRSPVEVFQLSSEPFEGFALCFHQLLGPLALSVLRTAEPVEEIDALREQMDCDESMENRFLAAMSLYNGDPEDPLTREAACEAATCLLHWGCTPEATQLSEVLERVSVGADDVPYAEAGFLLAGMASYQGAKSNAGRRPGQAAVQRLIRHVDDLGAPRRSSVHTFVGAWLGLYGDVDRALEHFEQAERAAYDVPDAGGSAYLAFSAHFRRSEVCVGDGAYGALEAARTLLPDLTPLHRALAVELLERASTHQDSTVAAVFARRAAA